MPLVSAVVVPHGDIVIPELAGPEMAALTKPLHDAMTEAGRRMEAARPETVVIATPHGVRVEGQVGVSMTEFAAGSLDGHEGTLVIEIPVDRLLAHVAAEDAEARGVPVARCVYGTSAGAESKLPLDWGAVVPLWYCGARWERPPRVVVVVPSRAVSEESLIDFGRSVALAANMTGRRVAFAASCDWAHAQAEDGPYGFHPDAALYDRLVQEIVASGDLSRFAGMDEVLIENAKPDGNWQALMLAGALEGSGLTAELLAYQCPTYFGMLVASFG